MKNIIIAVVFILLCIAGWYFFVKNDRTNSENRVDVGALNETTELVRADDFHLEFRYPKEAYTMLSAPLSGELQGSDLVASFVVVETAPYDAAVANGATEYPPIMSITVFANEEDETASSTEYVPRAQRLEEWARTYRGLTNIDGQKTEQVTETDVDGVNGITYTTDGLYTNKTYILAYRGYIYLVTMQSNGEAANDAAFQQVFDTIAFQ
jgi:hypothetical protein